MCRETVQSGDGAVQIIINVQHRNAWAAALSIALAVFIIVEV